MMTGVQDEQTQGSSDVASSVSGRVAVKSVGYDTLFVGDLAPWFRLRCIGQDGLFSFDMAAGRAVALCFYGSGRDPRARDAVDRLIELRGALDPAHVALFGVSGDPADEQDERLGPTLGLRHFADADGVVARLFGVAPKQGPAELAQLRRGWFVLDPRLRLVAAFPLTSEGGASVARYLQAPPTWPAATPQGQAPVLTIAGVFEPSFCASLIAFHQETGGEDSPVLTQGARVTDHTFKRRRDRRLTDPALIAQVQARLLRRVTPEIRHAFQFNATRMERLIVAAYDAGEAGRFGPHRDNTVTETAHRRFAVSINLNEGFDGGDLVFPEYSTRRFRPPLGAALVFSCSLMHAVLPMTQGRRYACLPFVYDDDAAELRTRRPGA